MNPPPFPDPAQPRKVRFLAVATPEPPSDHSLLRFGQGDLRGLDVEAIATWLARDPSLERRMEALVREEEARRAPVRLPNPLLDLVLTWVQTQGHALSASVELAGSQLRTTWSRLWQEVTLPPREPLTTRGTSGPDPSETRPIVQLVDSAGNKLTIERFRSGYRVEIRLKDPSMHTTAGSLQVDPLPCPHIPASNFGGSVPIDAQGYTAFARCPGGLYRIHGGGFNCVLHLAPLPPDSR